MDNNKSRFSLVPTYEMQTPPEPEMDWASYEQYLNTEWNNLLNSDPAPPEEDIQEFLEKHPAFLFAHLPKNNIMAYDWPKHLFC